MNKGLLFAIGAYVLWGLFPIYWKLLHTVSSQEIVAHRIIWSLFFMLILLTATKNIKPFFRQLKNKKILLVYSLAGTLLGINWLTYVWGVNAGFIVETSLGYFINPLVSVLLGVIFLKERLNRQQWIAIAVAFAGVLYLTIQYGALPWIALTLAFSFGTYGLIKKTAPLNAMDGLTMETLFLFAPALIYILFVQSNGTGSFGTLSWQTTLLLVLTGIITAVPLLFFAAAARRIPLSTVGIMQYIAPTLQFSIGVWLYHESFTQTRLIGFSMIWSALIIYTIDSINTRRHRTRAKAASFS